MTLSLRQLKFAGLALMLAVAMPAHAAMPVQPTLKVATLDGKKFDFAGKVRTDAKLSQMVASRWKSILLKPVDPFFKKNGAGAEIPVKVSGTKTAPKFGLDLHHKTEKNLPK